ncbi:MAG: ImmA/IrrE family metallo-endopeptidase [Oscillospiraceae bacterium]
MSDLFEAALKSNIEIIYSSQPDNESVSIQGDKACYIAVDYALMWNVSKERVHIAHEIGHCVTGSFYNIYSPLDRRTKHEERANRWAIEKLMPLTDLRAALSCGNTEPWELADYFCVTCEFVELALNYWTNTRGEAL